MSLEHSQLLFEQEVLLRLVQNLQRGGHTDPQTSNDMGVEAAALIGVLGPERLPRAPSLEIRNTSVAGGRIYTLVRRDSPWSWCVALRCTPARHTSRTTSRWWSYPQIVDS